MSDVIGILTDFGTQDIYVGVMKAVMLDIYPSAQLVDITHAIRPQNVREGAFALMNSYHYFPKGTTFCIVVDPGVGSTRLPIAVQTPEYNFIAPDNGVLSYTLQTMNTHYTAVAMENPKYQLTDVSYTFHGRDIFSPATAYIAKGDISLSDFGQTLDKVFTFPTPDLTYSNQRLIGEVMHIDHFGNVITSIGHLTWLDDENLQFSPVWKTDVPDLKVQAQSANITIHSHTTHGISHAYHEAQRGDILVQVDSNGFLEIGANQDHAADRLDVQVGDKVTLKLSN